MKPTGVYDRTPPYCIISANKHTSVDIPVLNTPALHDKNSGILQLISAVCYLAGLKIINRTIPKNLVRTPCSARTLSLVHEYMAVQAACAHPTRSRSAMVDNVLIIIMYKVIEAAVRWI